MKFDLVASLKEFFFDIIGFLIPGFLVIGILKYVFQVAVDINSNQSLIIISSYIIGYLIFAISLIKDKWINSIAIKVKITSANKIVHKLSQSDNYILATKIIDEKISLNEIKLNDFNSYRNFALSETPESNTLVYTFMFRAELFNQLHTISILSLLAAIIINIFCYLKLLNEGLIINYFYIGLFILMTMTLRKGWERFYRIAMNIPFSIYISKVRKNA